MIMSCPHEQNEAGWFEGNEQKQSRGTNKARRTASNEGGQDLSEGAWEVEMG